LSQHDPQCSEGADDPLSRGSARFPAVPLARTLQFESLPVIKNPYFPSSSNNVECLAVWIAILLVKLGRMGA